MEERRLSIVLTFCDKDFCYLERMLKEIQTKVEINHEVILVDNRNDKSKRINGKYDKIFINNDDNKTNFSRYKAIDYVTGERVWFLDCDDDICRIDKSFEKYLYADEDSVSFLYYNDVRKRWYLNDLSLWNKWLKTSKCLEYFKKFHNSRIIFGDDTLILAGLETELIVHKKIYIYHKSRSYFYSREGELTYEDFKKLSYGFENIRDEYLAIGKLDKYRIFIYKTVIFLANCVIPEDSRRCIYEIAKYIKKEDIKEILELIKAYDKIDSRVYKTIAFELYTEWTKLAQDETKMSVMHNTI